MLFKVNSPGFLVFFTINKLLVNLFLHNKIAYVCLFFSKIHRKPPKIVIKLAIIGVCFVF